MSGDSMDSITRLDKAECAPFRPLISAECDGDLTASERAHLYAHLETCADCRERRDAYRLNALRLQRLEHPDSPNTLKVALFARLGLDSNMPASTQASADSGNPPLITGTRPNLADLPPLLPFAEASTTAPVSLVQRLATRNARIVRVVGSLAAVFVIAVVVVVAIVLSRKPTAPAGFDNQIAASVPQKGAVNVPTTTQMSITFHRPVREESITASMTISPQISYQVWWNDHKTVLIVPDKGLVAGQTYTIHIDGSKAFYADGTPLGDPIDLMFVTVGPNTPDPTATLIPPTPTIKPTATPDPTATIKPTSTPVSTAVFGSLPTSVPTVTIAPSATRPATATVAGTRVGEFKITTAPATISRSTPSIAASPTHAPAITPSPAITNTVVPTATVAVTATLEPTVTLEPTAMLEPTATQEPTATATRAPTATQEPTQTAVPTQTTLPTQTAAPTQTVPPTEVVHVPGTVVASDDCTASAARVFGYLLAANPVVRKRAGCPSSGYVRGRVTLQQFQNGLMYLDAETKHIYVLLTAAGTWQVYDDLWTYGESDGNQSVPPTFYVPTRNLGKLWRDHKEVREALGWANAAPHDLSGVMQPFDNAVMLSNNLTTIYVLYTDSTFVTYLDPAK